MKALSILQPWAELVISGEKCFETRTWPTSHRGPLLIVASKRFPAELRDLCLRDPFANALDLIDAASIDARLAFGAILGTVILEACFPAESVIDHIDDLEKSLGNYAPGRFAWKLTNPRRFRQAIPYRGKLGLYEVPDKIISNHLDTTSGLSP